MRKHIVLSLITIGLMLSATGTVSAALAPRLAHYWDFEEVDPNVWADPNYNPNAPVGALDTANNYVQGGLYPERPLYPEMRPVITTTGRDGGTSVQVNNYARWTTSVVTPDPNDENPPALTQMDTPSFTLETWFRYDSSYRGWINPVGTWGQSVMIHMGGGMLWVGIGNQTWCTYNVTNPVAGQWNYLAISANADPDGDPNTIDGTVTSYYMPDGSPVTPYPNNLMYPDPNDPNTSILKPYDGVSTGGAFGIGHNHKAFTGYFDWTAIWNYALTPEEIEDHYLNGLTLTPGTPTDPNTPNLIPGDANGDNIVDTQDFTVLKAFFGTTTGGTWAMGDFTGDGVVDSQDFTILKAHFGESQSPGVPEPTTMALLALGGAAVLRRRRR